jgi:hypothetical protein
VRAREQRQASVRGIRQATSHRLLWNARQKTELLVERTEGPTPVAAPTARTPYCARIVLPHWLRLKPYRPRWERCPRPSLPRDHRLRDDSATRYLRIRLACRAVPTTLAGSRPLSEERSRAAPRKACRGTCLRRNDCNNGTEIKEGEGRHGCDGGSGGGCRNPQRLKFLGSERAFIALAGLPGAKKS